MVARHRGIAHTCLAGQPTPLRARGFGGQHHRHVDLGQAQAHGCAARRDAGRHVCAAHDQLVHTGGGAIGEGHQFVLLDFQEKLALGLDHAGHIDFHVAAHPRFIFDEIQVVQAGCRAHALAEVIAPTVDRDLQIIGIDRQRRAGVEMNVAIGRQGIARGHLPIGSFHVLQQKCALALRQGGAHATQAQTAFDVFKADAQRGGGHAACHHFLCANRQSAREFANVGHRHLAPADDDFLEFVGRGEREGARRRGQAGSDGQIDRTT